MVAIPLPDDFGTGAFGSRRRDAIDDRLAGIEAADLLGEFDRLVDFSVPIRDYLSVDDQEIEFARSVIRALPTGMAKTMLAWAIEHFWERQAGWPDLVLLRDEEVQFVEVKSPKDRLSEEQMRWFRWAVEEAEIPCSIAKVSKAPGS